MSKDNVKFRTSIGGQALMEGILMRGVDRQAIVVRKPDGELESKVEPLNPLSKRFPILGWPFIRGTVNFIETMVNGVKAISYSAEFLPEEEQEEPSKVDLWLEKHLSGEKAEKAVVGVSVFLGLVLAVGLFFMLPTQPHRGRHPHPHLSGVHHSGLQNEGDKTGLDVSRSRAQDHFLL